MKVIETERLILRTWKPEDADEYYRINQDPRVIELLLGPLTMQEVNDFIGAMNEQYEKQNFTLFAAEEKSTGKLIGFIGLNSPSWESHFTPCVEIGWRLGSQYWNQGYATEGAKAVLEYGFNQCGLKEIVSFTVPANVRSIRVMEKLGMIRNSNDDFAHPKLSSSHPLSKHVLYRINKYEGECACGAVKFSCIGEPFFTQYCHCNKCREVASLSLRDADKRGYALTAAYLTANFYITSGRDSLEAIIRKNAKLYLCKHCHALIYGISIDPALQTGLGINMNNFHFDSTIPASFNPVRHIWYSNHQVSFDDALPKYKDAPKEQFGSGELYP